METAPKEHPLSAVPSKVSQSSQQEIFKHHVANMSTIYIQYEEMWKITILPAQEKSF